MNPDNKRITLLVGPLGKSYKANQIAAQYADHEVTRWYEYGRDMEFFKMICDCSYKLIIHEVFDIHDLPFFAHKLSKMKDFDKKIVLISQCSIQNAEEIINKNKIEYGIELINCDYQKAQPKFWKPSPKLNFLLLTSAGYPQELFDEAEALHNYLTDMGYKQGLLPDQWQSLLDGIAVSVHVKDVDTFKIQPMQLNRKYPKVG